MYILSTGCQWAALRRTCRRAVRMNDYLRRWDEDGTLGRIHQAQYVQCRECRRETSPPARSRQPKRQECRKRGSLLTCPGTMQAKDKGKKRHVLVDTEVCCYGPLCTPPTSKTATAASLLMSTMFGLFPFY